jgi:hypothetical protein
MQEVGDHGWLWRWLTEDLLRHHAKADRWLDQFAGPSPPPVQSQAGRWM